MCDARDWILFSHMQSKWSIHWIIAPAPYLPNFLSWIPPKIKEFCVPFSHLLITKGWHQSLSGIISSLLITLMALANTFTFYWLPGTMCSSAICIFSCLILLEFHDLVFFSPHWLWSGLYSKSNWQNYLRLIEQTQVDTNTIGFISSTVGFSAFHLCFFSW